MNARVIVGQRVKDFLETLAPVPRRKLWRGLKGLAHDEGGWLRDEDRRQTARKTNIEHRTSNIEHPTSNIQHRTSNIELSTLNSNHSQLC